MSFSPWYKRTMSKILVIQSRRAPERCSFERCAYQRAAGVDVDFDFESTLNTEQEWSSPELILDGYDAVIIGGSSDFFLHGGKTEDDADRAGAHEVLERVRPLIEYLIANDFPTLGICFGHQLIAEVRGGNVTHDQAQKKMGTFDLQKTEAGRTDPLFGTLPDTFAGQYAHRDSVTTLPHGAVSLATGDCCRFSALRYGNNIYTLQFHPELCAGDLLDAREAVETYLSPGVSIESVLRESPETSRLVARFVSRIIR
jgi:GMP synthase (glutamine-hydrolysing)